MRQNSGASHLFSSLPMHTIRSDQFGSCPVPPPVSPMHPNPRASSEHRNFIDTDTMSSYPYTNSFALIRSILILIVVFGIIGSISQLVSGLFALANAQDSSTNNNNTGDRKTVELGAVAMLIMALICFTFELIGLLGALLRKVSVVSAFAVVMSIAIVVNCFIGDGGLKLLIILLNLIMTALSGVFVYMCIRQKEIEAFKQRHSMSISAIHESVSRESVFHLPN